MYNYAKVVNDLVVGIQSSTNEITHPGLVFINEEIPVLGSTYKNGKFLIVEDKQEETTAKIINIKIAEVAPQLEGFDNKTNEYTVNELTEVIATGSGLLTLYEMGLSKFRVPFVRTDTERKAYMVADIAADGKFSISMNFKTGGEWVVNSELLNSELSTAELALFSFSIKEHKFKVI